MFVLNPCTNDARVLKEADTLGRAGYDVKIIAIVSKDVSNFMEKKENFTIYRVKLTTLHMKHVLNEVKKGIKNIIIRIILRFRRALKANHEEKRTGLKKSINCVYPFSSSEKIIRHPVKTILQKFYRTIAYLSYWIKAKRLAVSFKADVYHAHDLTTLLPAYWAAKKIGSKVVYDSHELYSERNTMLKESVFSKWLIKKFESFLIRRVNTVITVNQSIASELSKLYDVPVPFTVMNCPPYQESIRNNLLREKLQLNGNIKIILYLGAITFNRGLEESISAMKEVNDSCLVLLGYGKPEYILSLKEIAASLSVENKVYFIPPVPYEEVVMYASSADIGLVPIKNVCKSYYYCSPNKLFESMMAGLPVAASDLPELRRVIEETKCGYLFNSSDPSLIASAINNIIYNEGTSEEMRQNALQHARKYSWENEKGKLLSIYDRLFTE